MVNVLSLAASVELDTVFVIYVIVPGVVHMRCIIVETMSVELSQAIHRLSGAEMFANLRPPRKPVLHNDRQALLEDNFLNHGFLCV